MVAFDLKAFVKEFSLDRRFCSKLFGVSERTVTRWCTAAQIPAPAMQLVRVIQRQSAPWNRSFSRGYRAGIVCMAWEWRQDLFSPKGGNWQDYRPKEERKAAQDLARRIEAAQAARAAQLKRVRLQAARKAAVTRAAKKAGMPPAQPPKPTPRPPPPAMAVVIPLASFRHTDGNRQIMGGPIKPEAPHAQSQDTAVRSPAVWLRVGSNGNVRHHPQAR